MDKSEVLIRGVEGNVREPEKFFSAMRETRDEIVQTREAKRRVMCRHEAGKESLGEMIPERVLKWQQRISN